MCISVQDCLLSNATPEMACNQPGLDSHDVLLYCAVTFLDVPTVALLSSIDRSWLQMSLPEEEFLQRVRECVIFDVPLFSAAFAFDCARRGKARFFTSDGHWYIKM